MSKGPGDTPSQLFQPGLRSPTCQSSTSPKFLLEGNPEEQHPWLSGISVKQKKSDTRAALEDGQGWSLPPPPHRYGEVPMATSGSQRACVAGIGREHLPNALQYKGGSWALPPLGTHNELLVKPPLG